MLLCQNPVNGWEVNTLRVNSGDVIPASLDIETIVAFRCSLSNLFSYYYPIFNETKDIITPQVIRGVTVLVTPEEDAELRLRDWSSSDEVRVDVNMWEPVGVIWDSYVKTTFYPMYAKGDMSCSVTIKRPINPEPFISNSSIVSSSAIKQWCYYISNTSNVQVSGTVGVVSEIVINGKISFRAMGSLITDNNGTQINNTSSFDGTVGDIYVNGYLKLDLHSNECCVYPEAQTEEDIDCNGN